MGWLSGWFRSKGAQGEARVEDGRPAAPSPILSGEVVAARPPASGTTQTAASGAAAATAAAVGGVVVLGAEVLHLLDGTADAARTTDPTERSANGGVGRHDATVATHQTTERHDDRGDHGGGTHEGHDGSAGHGLPDSTAVHDVFDGTHGHDGIHGDGDAADGGDAGGDGGGD